MRCAAYGGLAYEKPQSALCAFVRFFSGTFCTLLKPLRGFFIAAGKMSHTAGTLCEIWNTPNFLQKSIDKGKKKLENENAPSSLAAQGGYKMLIKMKTRAVFLILLVSFAVLSIGLVSCSNNSLANTEWQDTGGARTVSFGETSVTWQRKDTGFDRIGTYTISKDTIVITFDDGMKSTGTFIDGKLFIMANIEYLNEERVEFHRVK
jgi:hypothetical protein